MSKRILALLLCAVMLIPCLAACGKQDEENPDPGAYITMYLTDEIFDFDPANAAYNKETQNVLHLMYDTLFELDKNGKVKNSQVKKYTITENEVDGYKAVISGDTTEGFTVTNSHTPVPKTGDARNPLLYLALMLISGGALTAIGFYSKKKKANG